MADKRQETTASSAGEFRKYTTIAGLLPIIRDREITLLDPLRWEDRNDAEAMGVYKTRNGRKTLLASCFAQGPETYGHWKAFSSTPEGAAISFDRNIFLESIKELNEIPESNELRMEKVEYKSIDKLPAQIDVREIPFLKRYPYRGEEEFRIIYESNGDEGKYKNLCFACGSIREIRLSPWLHEKLVEPLKEVIQKSVPKDENIRIFRSTLLENHKWLEKIRAICN